MPVATYEGMFLLDSTKAATAWDDTVKHVHDILTKHHSEIVASRQWDERRLAYPIDGHKKGTYLLTYFKTDGSNLKEIVADCHLSDVILRELVLKVHPKLADHLVNQAMTSTPNVDAEAAARTRTTSARAAAAATIANDAAANRRGSRLGTRSWPEPAAQAPCSRPILEFLLLSMRRECVSLPRGEQPSSIRHEPISPA